MSDESNKSKQRRKLLKSLALGGGAFGAATVLPEKWARPLVESVVLPAHAQATCSAQFAGTYTGTTSLNRSRCSGGQDVATPDITIVIGGDCSVEVTLQSSRPFFGTGVLLGNNFSVVVSRDTDCGAPTGRRAGSGPVNGTITNGTISGDVSISGDCTVCGSPTEPVFTLNGSFHASV